MQKSLVIPGVTSAQLEALRMENLGVWCALNRFKVDHRPFTFSGRKYLKNIYTSTSPFINVRKCTQVGLTIWMVLKVLHKLRYAEFVGDNIPKKAGFYFPVHDSVAKFSKDRLQPLIDNVSEFREILKGQGSIELKQLGNSSLYMSYMGGTATKDSTPLDIVCLDETRLMELADINQVEERLSGCPKPEMYKISTAGYPNDAIDKAFLQGNQQHWHTKCGCPDGVILSDSFPECIGQRKVKGGITEYFYRCPRCGVEISDPQDGGYFPHNSGADIESFHVHQMLSPTYTPKRVWEKYITSDNPKEFYNACLGKPYVDEDNVGITDEELRGCVNTDISWNEEHFNTHIGVDQRSGDLHVVISRWINNKRRIIHLEVIDNYAEKYRENGKIVSPFKRLYSIMQEFDVDMGIVDALPNINEAKEFAAEFPGRIFLSFYRQSQEMAQWSDKRYASKNNEKPQLRRSSQDLKFKWTVILDRYRSIEYSLRQWRQRRVEIGNPKAVVQEVRNEKTGLYEPTHVCEAVFFKHLKAVARELVQSRTDSNRVTYRWANLGLDPHFLHAWNYCCISMERKKKVFQWDLL